MLVRTSLLLAVSIVLASFLISEVSGAGHSKNVKKTEVPSHWRYPKTFPTKEELEASPQLREMYTGDNRLQVHMVPHTHDDVGWLKTIDQYFLGANNSIQHAAVKYILDTVVEELLKDPSRKFIYIEQEFFQTWWVRQTAETQANVRNLVANGQLEFGNGGWCMHDEANTHYMDMIDQTTLGHQFIKQQFGVTPKFGWQIDPFGHSATQAALLSAQVGFEALFFGRIDHQDHDQRMMEKNMEFLWRPSPSLGVDGQVFSGAFQNGNYGPPDGFCFDTNCDDTPIVTDDAFMDFNVPNRLQAFLDRINYQAAFTLGRNLMITMGSDFQYENAREWFENLDRLLEIVNADGRINLFYSTPSLYTEAKNAENITFTVKTDDFFPYSDDDHAYWTGYFTSRPALKRYVRTASALLQTARQLEIFSGMQAGNATMPLSKAVGVVQHHDAVAGTAKQHVTFDYAQRVHKAQVIAEDMMTSGMGNIVTEGHSGSTPPSFEVCELANITVCDLTTTGSPNAFQVVFYNPLGRARSERVQIPISNTQLVVLDSNGNTVSSQVTAVYNVSSHTPDSAQHALNFVASVQAMGFSTYFVQAPSAKQVIYNEAKHHVKGSTSQKLKAHLKASKALNAVTYVSSLHRPTVGADSTISNEYVALTFDGNSGMVKSYQDKVSGNSYSFGVQYGYYESYAGDGQKSGAYIFRPAVQQLFPISGPVQILLQSGPVVQEIIQLVNPWINQTFRVVAGQPFVEVEYTVGEIPINDNVGKEVVIQYQTQLASKGTWFSDSNAREMQQRQRDYRPSFNLTVTEPISGNYVPMNAAAYLTDGITTLSVLNDRSQGVVSMTDGVLEIMVHRRTLQDDSRGVGEPMNETDYISPYPDFIREGRGLVITGTHYLTIGNATGAASLWRPQLQKVYQPFTAFYSSIPANYQSTHNLQGTFFNADLPVNVDLISFQTWSAWSSTPNQALVRIAHQFAVGEDSFLSQPVKVDVSTLFAQTPTAIQQVSLTATKNVDSNRKNIQQMQWNAEENPENLRPPTSTPMDGSVITLEPMEIATFLVTF